MKQPTFNGLAAAESLYKRSGREHETGSKLVNPSINSNLYGRPSLIPGVEYPTTEREERLLDLAWQHTCNLRTGGCYE